MGGIMAATIRNPVAGGIPPTPGNIVVNPDSCNIAPWGIFANGTATMPTFTAGQTDPNGGSTAVLVNIDRSSNSDFSIVTQTLPGTPTGTFNYTAYFKAATGADIGKTIYAVVFVTPKPATAIVLTGSWVKFTMSTQVNPTDIFFGYPENGSWTAPATGPVSFVAWRNEVFP